VIEFGSYRLGSVAGAKRPSAGLRGLRFDQHACRRVRLLNILMQVVALEDDSVTSKLPYLLGSFFPTHDIQRLDPASFATLMMYCPMAEFAAV
jgi:hypothetical protein